MLTKLVCPVDGLIATGITAVVVPGYTRLFAIAVYPGVCGAYGPCGERRKCGDHKKYSPHATLLRRVIKLRSKNPRHRGAAPGMFNLLRVVNAGTTARFRSNEKRNCRVNPAAILFSHVAPKDAHSLGTLSPNPSVTEENLATGLRRAQTCRQLRVSPGKSTAATRRGWTAGLARLVSASQIG